MQSNCVFSLLDKQPSWCFVSVLVASGFGGGRVGVATARECYIEVALELAVITGPKVGVWWHLRRLHSLVDKDRNKGTNACNRHIEKNIRKRILLKTKETRT
eukprot:1294133-Amphidinium_carterae.4